MKVTKFKQELAKLDSKQLEEKLDQLNRELFGLRLNAQTGHVKNNAQFKQLRKDIARVKTFINQSNKAVSA